MDALAIHLARRTHRLPVPEVAVDVFRGPVAGERLVHLAQQSNAFYRQVHLAPQTGLARFLFQRIEQEA